MTERDGQPLDILARFGMSDLRMSRRAVLKRAVALGLSAPVIAALLAACGGDDDSTSPTATTAAGGATATTGGSTGAATATTGGSTGAATATTGSGAAATATTATGRRDSDLRRQHDNRRHAGHRPRTSTT